MGSCPKCGRGLGGAYACICGWKAQSSTLFDDAPVALGKMCSRQPCPLKAKTRIKTADGWDDVCGRHYTLHFESLATVALDKYGLGRGPDEPHDEWIERIRASARQGVKPVVKPQLLRDVSHETD
jgi:hypothetical protein